MNGVLQLSRGEVTLRGGSGIRWPIERTKNYMHYFDKNKICNK